MNELEALNRALFLKINGGNGTPPWLIKMAILIANDLIYLIPLLLLSLWLWGNSTRRALAMKAFLVTLMALGMNQVIGLMWMHPRPFMLGLGHTWMDHAAESSFPSDHVTVFASVGLVFLRGTSFRLAMAVLAAGITVAWARIFVGVHFPLDMVGAAGVAGGAYGLISWLWPRMGEPLFHGVECLYRRLLARPIAAGWIRS